MNGKILFFDEWKNFNASLNEEIESRKLTEKQKKNFIKMVSLIKNMMLF